MATQTAIELNQMCGREGDTTAATTTVEQRCRASDASARVREDEEDTRKGKGEGGGTSNN